MNEYTGVDDPHVLILRLWSEPRTGADTAPEWRALIEHVNTRKRYPIKDMAALYALLAPYGDDMALDDFLASQTAQDER
jgi:aspartate/tyrosine/aromatic aminotransferase